MDQFDIIVVGGGSRGRGSAAARGGGKRTVCLLEAGGANDMIRIKTPGFMPLIAESDQLSV